MKKRVVTPFHSDDAKNAVVAVGPSSGRGFVMEISVTVERITILNRMVVTAAHCLPELPAATGLFDVRDKTYPNLLGPLGIRKPSIMAECLFADPVADIAVLGAPDGQAYGDAYMKWDKFMQRTSSLQLNARKMGRPTTAWLLSLDGRWTTCIVKSIQCGGLGNDGLWITEAVAGIMGGMSGSPILLDDGRAIGVVCNSGGGGDTMHTEGGPQPWLTRCLPGWLVQPLVVADRQRRRSRKN